MLGTVVWGYENSERRVPDFYGTTARHLAASSHAALPFRRTATSSCRTQGHWTSLTRRKASPACELFPEIRRCSFHVLVPARRVADFHGTIFNSLISIDNLFDIIPVTRHREQVCGTGIRHTKRTRCRGIRGRRGALKVPDTRTAHLLSPSGFLFLARQRPGGAGWELAWNKTQAIDFREISI